MKPSARGLTFIEILAAMALLGLLSAALSSWLQLTSAFATRSAATLPWEICAEQVMHCIQEDLLTGDFVPDKGAPQEPRCIVVDSKLTIRTRDARCGSAQREYRFEVGPSAAGSSNGHLVRSTRPAASTDHGQETRILIGDISAWICSFDANAQRLTVSLTSTAGRTIRRSFACPP